MRLLPWRNRLAWVAIVYSPPRYPGDIRRRLERRYFPTQARAIVWRRDALEAHERNRHVLTYDIEIEVQRSLTKKVGDI